MSIPNLTVDQALTVFRGWDSLADKFRYGSLDLENWKDPKIMCINETYDVFVEKDSIGIFTGQFDKNKVPIFASVPSAKLGGDNVKFYQSFWNSGGAGDYKNKEIKFIENNTLGFAGFQIINNCEVVGTQYEEHLKDTK